MNKNWIFIGLLVLAATSLGAQSDIHIIDADDLFGAFHEEAANRIEEELSAYEREPYLDADTTGWSLNADGWEDVFRTSEWETVMTDRPQGRRIGCICMDGSPQDEKGRGACGGRGGVRFWLHQQGDSIFMDPTLRHKAHPQPFTEEQKERLAAYNEKGTPMGAAANRGFARIEDFKDIVMVMMVCLTIAYVARLYFSHNTEPI